MLLVKTSPFILALTYVLFHSFVTAIISPPTHTHTHTHTRLHQLTFFCKELVCRKPWRKKQTSFRCRYYSGKERIMARHGGMTTNIGLQSFCLAMNTNGYSVSNHPLQ